MNRKHNTGQLLSLLLAALFILTGIMQYLPLSPAVTAAETETVSEALNEPTEEHIEETETKADTEAPTAPEPETKTDSVSVPEAAAENETARETETAAQAEAKTMADTETEAISDAEAAAGPETAGPAETETETEVETAAEAETEAETETVTEADTETETEKKKEDREDRLYSVCFEVSEGYSFSMENNQVSYHAGDPVSFDVLTGDGCLLKEVNAWQTELLADDDTDRTAAAVSPDNPVIDLSLLLMEEPVMLTQTACKSDFQAAEAASDETGHTSADGSDTDSFTFTMPESDVLLTASVLKAASQEVPVELDYGGVKNVPKAWVPDGVTWARGGTTFGYSRYRTVEINGKTRICYCLQPSLAADDEGSYTATELTNAKLGKLSAAEATLLRKALFYCYGGPGWKTDDIKAVLSDCSDSDEYYAASHFILSKIYTDAVGGNWNEVLSANQHYTAMNSRGTAAVEAAVAKINNLPDPSASLSSSQVSASYNASTGFAHSQSVTYSSNVEGNDLTLTLPDKVFLVAGSKEYAPGQQVTLSPGTTFYLKKNGYSTAHSQTFTLKTAIFADYEAYLINTSASMQNMGFSYVADSTLTLSVSWPDLLTRLNVVKTDTCTGSSSPSPHYRLDGAVYGIYEDQAKTRLLEELTIRDGQAVSEEKYLIGQTYYIAEISPMPEYHLDEKVYAVTATAGGKAAITSADTPKTLKISLQKTDLETGQSRPQTAALSFAGAVFGIYADEACSVKARDMDKNEVPDLVTDENGYAATAQNLLIGDYWIKEHTAPEGYLVSDKVLHISADEAADEILEQDSDAALTAAQQIIRGNVDLMKIKNEKDQSITGAKGVIFHFTYTKDPSVTFKVGSGSSSGENAEAEDNVIITDETGYATTADPAYPLGTLIYGEWLVTEENTPEGYDPIDPLTIMVNSHGRTYRFTANNRRIHAQVLIEKRDKNTGTLIPVPGVTFSILRDGEPVCLFDSVSRDLVSTWTTDADGCVQLPDSLDYGTYTLKEDPATVPEGYYCMESREFTVSERADDPLSPFILTAAEPPQTGLITITKQNADTDEYLQGFTFRIIASKDITDMTGVVRTGTNAEGEEVPLTAGTVVEELTTDDTGTAVSKELYIGDYVIEETAVMPGFAISVESRNVTVAPDPEKAAAGECSACQAAFRNKPTTLHILKTDSLTGKPLAGAVFRIEPAGNGAGTEYEVTNDAGTEYEVTTGADGTALLEMLPPGTTFTVTEITVPEGWNADAAPQTFTVDENGLIDGQDSISLTFTNTPNTVRISKQEITGGAEIPGAKLTVKNAQGEVVETWVSTDQPHAISGLKAGDYTLTEELPAPGYASAETILFTVTNSLSVQTVVMKDDVTKVKISKSDITDGKPVTGAKLVIRDEDGKKVASWTSGKKPHYIEKLPVGKYTLTEKTAPAGYEVAETVEFEVKDTGQIQKVVMYDSPRLTTRAGGYGRSGSGSSPRTDDRTPVRVTLVVCLLSLAAVIIILRRLRDRPDVLKDQADHSRPSQQ